MKTGSDLSENELTSLSLALDFITLARVDANVVLYGSFGFWWDLLFLCIGQVSLENYLNKENKKNVPVPFAHLYAKKTLFFKNMNLCAYMSQPEPFVSTKVLLPERGQRLPSPGHTRRERHTPAHCQHSELIARRRQISLLEAITTHT